MTPERERLNAELSDCHYRGQRIPADGKRPDGSVYIGRPGEYLCHICARLEAEAVV